MRRPNAALAVPGDLNMKTGGYIYDRRLVDELRLSSHDVTHIELPAGFPDPTPSDMAESFKRLQSVTQDCPVIIDGLAFGALDTRGVKNLRMPIVALIHHPLAKESGLSTERQRALLKTERNNLSFAKHVLVPSPHTAEILICEYAVPEHKITIARPGTDRPKKEIKRDDPPLILSVGIQLPRKGHDILLKALAGIVDLEWRCVIVGAPLDKAYSHDLHALCGLLGLEKRVTLAGLIARDELSELYRSAGCFALATRFEGYGIVFDEALAHGLPIVSCNTGAVPDTVPSAASRLVQPDDSEAFAHALRELLSDPKMNAKLSMSSLEAGQRLPSWAETAEITAKTLSLISSY